ncbi:flagellar export protein FliJ [Rhodopirellula halodulae]|uniref:flagellar export protein FliJ n=1 Tax=Rhodopirellula halodulae TaxID=2894198 RepID=UPI001E4FD6DB|nr:flagellar export protein FliJ [Rhodopirellula sp. JC737]MCC9655720.1 flagellar export protein FliJ [Rhodopirellula sp. JC737]
MRPFRFRFDSLLDLRARERDEAGAEVGKAEEAIQKINDQITDIDRQREAIRTEKHQTLQQANVSVDQMLHQGRYDVQLHADQVSLRQTLTQLHEELNKRRDKLILAEAEVKRLERLRETQLAEHRMLVAKQEQAEADDLTSARVLLRRRAIASQNAADSKETQR